MNWEQLDFPTRAGFVTGVMALLGLIVSPISTASAFVAMGFSGVGWQRSRQREEANSVAEFVFLASALLVVLVLVGNAVYGAAS